MALWPPSLINSDKSSLSAGVHKVSDWHCALQIKISHELKDGRKHVSFLAADKRDI